MTLYTVILCTSIQAYAFIFNHYVYDIYKSDLVTYIPVLYQLPAALNVCLSLSDLCIRLYVQTSRWSYAFLHLISGLCIYGELSAVPWCQHLHFFPGNSPSAAGVHYSRDGSLADHTSPDTSGHYRLLDWWKYQWHNEWYSFPWRCEFLKLWQVVQCYSLVPRLLPTLMLYTVWIPGREPGIFDHMHCAVNHDFDNRIDCYWSSAIHTYIPVIMWIRTISCAWDRNPHLLVIPVQVTRPGIGQNVCCVVVDFEIAARSAFFIQGDLVHWSSVLAYITYWALYVDRLSAVTRVK